MKFNVIVKEDKLDGGYIAYVPELKGCFTQADSLDELKKNIIEAIEVSLDENEEINPIFGIWEVEVNAATSYN
jgi:predicted RNase H-like HicB family nuclease